MLAVTVAGCGTPLQMSVRVSPRLRLWPSVSPTARVSEIHYMQLQKLTWLDANLFKDAFIKAQQENEKLFSAEA